jgi:hypothetical protein
MLWLPILAVAFGFAAHALSTDGGGSVLARAGITSWAIPKAAVPVLVLACGLAAMIFDGVSGGQTWQVSAAHGVLVTLEAFFGVTASQRVTGRDALGHALPPTDAPPTSPRGPFTGPLAALAVFVAVAFAAMVAGNGCALFTPANLPQTALVAKDVTCILEHVFVDDATLNKLCDLLTAERRAAAQAVVAAERVRASKRGACVTLDAGADAADGGAR